VRAVVLFRFHAHPELCRERLKLIRHLNPTLPVYGLYGGVPSDADYMRRVLSPWLDGFWSIEGRDDRWKWLHQDLAVRDWFERQGSRVAFDRLYDYEYDLLLVRPFEKLIPQIADRAIALSGLKKLDEVRSTWYWTSVEPFASGFERYARFMSRRHGAGLQTYVSQGPFPMLSRSFLEAVCGVEWPQTIFDWVNCETSYPGAAEALGFDLIDTGLHPGWTAGLPSASVSPLFHCERAPLVQFPQIESALRDPLGRRAFHPVKECVPFGAIAPLVEALS